jgi:hypothetical protein
MDGCCMRRISDQNIEESAKNRADKNGTASLVK